MDLEMTRAETEDLHREDLEEAEGDVACASEARGEDRLERGRMRSGPFHSV